jgi:hypothetical protein
MKALTTAHEPAAASALLKLTSLTLRRLDTWSWWAAPCAEATEQRSKAERATPRMVSWAKPAVTDPNLGDLDRVLIAGT